MTEPEQQPVPDREDDEQPKLTAEEWAYIAALTSAEDKGGDH